jgi:pimeloyl-ACP methyl ester carboxylesterase
MNASIAMQPVARGRTSSGVYYEVHGRGVPLFLGFPVLASYASIFGADAAGVRDGFLARLVDRYSVLLVDYPSIGGSDTIPADALTLDRVCDDLLAVADAAGFDRFAWWGATFGAVAGLELAARTSRVAALVSAGWSPLGMPYDGMVRGAREYGDVPPPHARVILRTPAQYAQWATFYGSLPPRWEEDVNARLTCPRVVVYGANAESSVGSTALPIAATIRASRARLESLGWRLVEVPDADAALVLDPAALVPPARAFLDSVLPESNTITGERR